MFSFKILHGKFHQIKILITYFLIHFLQNIVAFFLLFFPWRWYIGYGGGDIILQQDFPMRGFDVPSKKGHGRKLDEAYFMIGGWGTMDHLYLINPAPSAASLTQVTTKLFISGPIPFIAICFFFLRHACGLLLRPYPPPPMHLHACF